MRGRPDGESATCPGCGRALWRQSSGGVFARHRRTEHDPSSAWCNGAPQPARVTLSITSVEISVEGEVDVRAALGVLRQLAGGGR